MWAKIWPWIAAKLGYEVARQGAKLPVRIAVMAAWATFLGVVFTGLTGLEVHQQFHANPYSGVGSDVLGLVCSVFPVHFSLGLFGAYVTWRLTVMGAAQVMNKALLWIFGA